MDKTELVKLLNELEETAYHEIKWGKIHIGGII